MRQALISDIHGNLEALDAVMADIETRQVDRIVCLGDIVGYGPNPCQCLDIVTKKSKLTILGNHDQAVMFDPDGFNPLALRAIYWTRDQLDHGPGGPTTINDRWDFLGNLPKMHRDKAENILYVHGSPREPTDEYVFPESIYDESKMRLLFDRVDWLCFQGHTHMPGVFTQDFDFVPPEACDFIYPLNGEKLMINVGSVGQPRDEDNRSCYAVLDTDKKRLEYYRVKYDVDKTADKIYAIAADLRDESFRMLGDRLKVGR